VLRWRLGVALVLLLFVGIPLGQPVALLLAEPGSWRAWEDAARLLALSRNTLFLVAGTLAVSLPLGTLAAILLYRTDLPLRGPLRFLVLLTLFVPLPLFTSGWQAVLGSGGWLPLDFWNPPRDPAAGFASGGNVWTPWGQGIGSAVWIQAVAALPWVILLVGQGLCWVERELEEDALTAAGPWRVLLSVTLPRCGAAIGMAAVWVALLTATEITVSDVMQVRTFAEEVYTQFVVPEPVQPGEGPGGPLARSLAVTLPFVLTAALVLVGMAGVFERKIPPRDRIASPPLVFRLGRARWAVWAGSVVVGIFLFASPLLSLVWRAGREGVPPAWSWQSVRHHMNLVAQTEGVRLRDSLLVAGGAGGLCAALGLAACWAALETRRFRAGVLVLMALAWSMPGPVLGSGLKATIDQLLSLTHSAWLRQLLWDGPSSAPVLWVDLIRFFPCAVAVLWPVTRLLPVELRDQARVDGATPGQELFRVVLPLSAAAWFRAALAVAVLALGELSAGKIVSTPDKETYAEAIFVQMHYGVTNDLAARCLWLLAAVAAGGVLTALVGRLTRHGLPLSAPAAAVTGHFHQLTNSNTRSGKVGW
jgi:iron(III) transport system permease protein